MTISPTTDDAHETEPEMSTVIVDPWIKVVSEFNTREKLRSERKGRFSQSEWLSYHRKKQAAFCDTCTEYRQAHDNSPFIFTESATGLCNWKKGVERLKDHS